MTVPRTEESRPGQGEQFLQRLSNSAREKAPDGITVRSERLGADEYLADPTDHVRVIERFLANEQVEKLYLDPKYTVDATAPTLQPVEAALDAASIEFERVPVPTSWLSTTRPELRRGLAVGLVLFGFYLLLTDPTATDHVLWGIATATLAGILFRNVTFETTPKLLSMPVVLLRALLVIPYLFWKILAANVQFAAVVLHPSLPIEPWLDRIDARVDDGLSVTALANSLTLTPGTLTVDANGSKLLIHSLNASTRTDLLAGNRERAIRFVFYGRPGLKLDSIWDRDDSTVVVSPDTSPEQTSREESDE